MIKWQTYTLLFILSAGVAEAMLLAYSYFIIFASLIFFTVAADVLSFHMITIPRLCAVTVSRRIERVASAGTFEVSLDFKGARAGAVYFRYSDRIADSLRASGNYSGTAAVGRGRDATRTYSASSSFFGRHALGPVLITASDPFGLCSHTREAGETDHVSIPPLIAGGFATRGEPARKIFSGIGANTLPRAGQGYQFLSIRPYSIYDDSRRIAWNRYGTVDGEDVYVKEMEDERTTDSVFIIDFSEYTNIGQTDRIYCSEISSALRASFAICKPGDRVGYLLYSSTRNLFVSPSQAATAARQLQSILSSTEPDGIFRLSDAMEALRKHFSRSALTLLITPLLGAGPGRIRKESVSSLLGRSVRLIVPEASTYFGAHPADARQALMSLLISGRRNECVAAVKSLNGFGIRTRLSSSGTLLADVAKTWYEGRYAYAGF